MDKGWAEEPFDRNEVILLTTPDKKHDVLVPAEEYFIDYLDIMEHTIETVAAIYNINVHEVLSDLLSPPVNKLIEIQYITKRIEELVDRYDDDVVIKNVLALLKERERMLEVLAPICDITGDE